MTWQYEYTKLIGYLDQYADESEERYRQAWTYTKHMINAHAKAIQTPDMSNEESSSLAWSQFESTFDENDDALLSLAGIVVHLVNSVPLGQTLAFHQAVEVAFLLARGFDQANAVQQHKKAMAQSLSGFTDFQLSPANSPKLEAP